MKALRFSADRRRRCSRVTDALVVGRMRLAVAPLRIVQSCRGNGAALWDRRRGYVLVEHVDMDAASIACHLPTGSVAIPLQLMCGRNAELADRL